VGIGTVERGREFCAHVEFPVEALLCDPDNVAYSALGLKFGVADTFFNPETPYAIARRLAASVVAPKAAPAPAAAAVAATKVSEQGGKGASSPSSSPSSSLLAIENRGAADLAAALARWKPWIPPKLEQGLQQGGMFVFNGDQEAFSYYDPSTGSHADLNTVLIAALEADGGEKTAL